MGSITEKSTYNGIVTNMRNKEDRLRTAREGGVRILSKNPTLHSETPSLANAVSPSASNAM